MTFIHPIAALRETPLYNTDDAMTSYSASEEQKEQRRLVFATIGPTRPGSQERRPLYKES